MNEEIKLEIEGVYKTNTKDLDGINEHNVPEEAIQKMEERFQIKLR